MRMMMLVELPLEPFNTAVRNGTAGPKMKKILDDIKPEAAYFGEREGSRGGILIVNLEQPVGRSQVRRAVVSQLQRRG